MFYFGNLKSDCPESQTVSELGECKAAGAKLGKDFGGIVQRTDRPAGCYYIKPQRNISSSILSSKEFYFNPYSPADTHNIHKHTGGICKSGISDIS